MVAGRPRTSSPPPEECIELGKELVQWATEETKEWRCLFQQWYSIKKGILRKDWKNIIETPEFSPYYEIAQAALSVKCVDGTMKERFGERYIRLYDRGLIEVENEQAKFDAELKKVEENRAPQIIEFMVNYSNDPKHPIEILPKTISNPDSSST